MKRSGWAVVGLGVLFLVIQSCGEEFGNGRIVPPGSAYGADSEQQQVAGAQQPVTEDGGTPDGGN
ncbi:MAG: hypothetical protein IPJ65_38415 [Archangiaceae bacterium]|nr:hypothetical protein [Archangiaceae bacterium]